VDDFREPFFGAQEDATFELALGVVRDEPVREVDDPAKAAARELAHRGVGGGRSPGAAHRMVEPGRDDRAEA
jgi:hypothetical protein